MPRRSTKLTVAITRRRAEVADFLLRGISSQDTIARALSVSQSTISADIQAVRAAWQAEAVRDFDAAQSQELAKLDNLEAKYWAGWEKSREPKKTTRTKSAEAGEEVTTEFTAGNPRFLDGVLDCIKKRCQLLGLDEQDMIDRARQRSAQQQPAVQVNITTVSYSELEAMARAGQVIPDEALKRLSPQELTQIHHIVIEH